MKKKPAIIDLFCGPGGLSTGFKQAGFEIATAVDENESALNTFTHNHQCAAIQADIAELPPEQINNIIRENGYELEDICALVGGPPCKGVSQVNRKTRSPDNPLNDLFFEFIEIADDISPPVVVMENVPAISSKRGGDKSVLDSVREGLEEAGYTVSVNTLEAKHYGVPQTRPRVFFIGVKEGTPPFPNPTHLESTEDQSDPLDDNLPRPVTVREAIFDLPELPPGGGGEEVMKYESEPHSSFAREMRAKTGETLFNHRSTVNQEQTQARFKHIPQGGNWEDIPDELMDNYSNPDRTHKNIYHRLREHKPSLTVTNFRKSMTIHPTQDRLLSVREAARLQSFPDDYRFISKNITDQQQMVGDAVPVKLAEAVAKTVKEHLQASEPKMRLD